MWSPPCSYRWCPLCPTLFSFPHCTLCHLLAPIHPFISNHLNWDIILDPVIVQHSNYISIVITASTYLAFAVYQVQILVINLHNNTEVDGIITSFHRCRNPGKMRLSDFPKVNTGARTQTQCDSRACANTALCFPAMLCLLHSPTLQSLLTFPTH